MHINRRQASPSRGDTLGQFLRSGSRKLLNRGTAIQQVMFFMVSREYENTNTVVVFVLLDGHSPLARATEPQNWRVGGRQYRVYSRQRHRPLDTRRRYTVLKRIPDDYVQSRIGAADSIIRTISHAREYALFMVTAFHEDGHIPHWFLVSVFGRSRLPLREARRPCLARKFGYERLIETLASFLCAPFTHLSGGVGLALSRPRCLLES